MIGTHILQGNTYYRNTTNKQYAKSIRKLYNKPLQCFMLNTDGTCLNSAEDVLANCFYTCATCVGDN